jgi:uncharacterized protein (TIGR00369 family)
MSRADRYEPLDATAAERWSFFDDPARGLYPNLLGLVVEEIRVDYCRMRLPFKPSLLQAGGVVHGGAIASLLDSAVVPAIGGTLPAGARYSTVDQHVQYIGALVDCDAIAEGWVVRRGRRTVFCESEAVEADTGRLIARSLLTYSVSPPKD